MDHAMHHFDAMTTAEKIAGIAIAAILFAIGAAHFLH
jgi:hypothetical protein